MKKIKIVFHEYPFSYYGCKLFDCICFIGSVFYYLVDKIKIFFCFIGSKLPFEIEIQ